MVGPNFTFGDWVKADRTIVAQTPNNETEVPTTHREGYAAGAAAAGRRG